MKRFITKKIIYSTSIKYMPLKNKRTLTWFDHHEEELVFTEVFKRTEEDEQEQEQGYGRGKKRRKQIISPKLSSSSIYALKLN